MISDELPPMPQLPMLTEADIEMLRFHGLTPERAWEILMEILAEIRQELDNKN